MVGHGRSCVCSFVARCSPVAPPACPSLACLLVRCFPVCCSFTSLSARAMVAGSSLVHLLPVAAPSTRLSRVCLLVSHGSVYSSRGHGSYRWSVCSLVTGPWVRVMSLVRLFGSWSLVCILDSSLAFSCVAGLPLVR